MLRKLENTVAFRSYDVQFGQYSCDLGNIRDSSTGFPIGQFCVLDVELARQLSLSDSCIQTGLPQSCGEGTNTPTMLSGQPGHPWSL